MNQMRTAFVVLVTLFAGVLSGTPQRSDQGEVLLQKAIHKEMVEGKLEEAIQIYKEVFTASKNNRALAARALVQMGQCYEKLGNAEARNAYERVIKEFADQGEQVQAARTKLAALSAPEAKPKFTKIRVPTKLPRGTEMAISADGQQLAYVADGSVWLLPVHGASAPEIAGAPRRITARVDNWSVTPSITWSRDGKWIAFHVWQGRPEGGEDPVICIVPSAGGAPRRIPLGLKNLIEQYWDHGLGLSPDGKHLAYTTYKESEGASQRSIYMIPTDGGAVRRVTQPVTREPAFSPDGKWMAFVGLLKDPERDPDKPLGRQVWVMPIAGGAPVLVYELPRPGMLRGPIWSPDGRRLAFLATSDMTDDVPSLLVSSLNPDGHPAGAPLKIELPQPTDYDLAGWGADNKIAVMIPIPETELLYTVPAGGGSAVQLTPKDAFQPAWSRDGKLIYFDGCNLGQCGKIESVPASGGKITRLPFKGPGSIYVTYPTGGVSVSPDGKKILFDGGVIGAPVKEVGHIFTIPTDGGDVTDIPTGKPWVYQPCWSPDGKSIAFLNADEIPQRNGMLYNIYTMPAEGGRIQQITSPADKVLEHTRIAWSPDGKHIAYYSEGGKLKLVPAGGGPSRVLVEGLEGYYGHSGLAWSPNGEELAYIKQNRIWRLNLSTGMSDEVHTGLDAVHTHFAWSPDGSTIAFSAIQGGEPELWLMSDFLPLLKSAK
jgi:Tol biopolymer transport system component